MLEQRGDLWVLAHQLNCDAVCFTSNGFVKKNGQAVTGKGSALEATLRWPDIPVLLGNRLKISFHVELFPKHLFKDMFYDLVAFPVKPKNVIVNNTQSNLVKHHHMNFRIGSVAPGWAALADINIIKKSAGELMSMIDENRWNVVLLVRPGCGNGGLRYEDVKPVIQPIFDDRIIIVSK